jgi:hypothetical protein
MYTGRPWKLNCSMRVAADTYIGHTAELIAMQWTGEAHRAAALVAYSIAVLLLAGTLIDDVVEQL